MRLLPAGQIEQAVEGAGFFTQATDLFRDMEMTWWLVPSQENGVIFYVITLIRHAGEGAQHDISS